jgi:hypothetical protein
MGAEAQARVAGGLLHGQSQAVVCVCIIKRCMCLKWFVVLHACHIVAGSKQPCHAAVKS